MRVMNLYFKDPERYFFGYQAISSLITSSKKVILF
jgi:hypothetical protein